MKNWWKTLSELYFGFLLLPAMNNNVHAQFDDLICVSLNPKQNSWNETIFYEIGPRSQNNGSMVLKCTSSSTNLSLKWYKCNGFSKCKIEKLKTKINSRRCTQLISQLKNEVYITPPNHRETGCVVMNAQGLSTRAVKYTFGDICHTPTPTQPLLERYTCSLLNRSECKVSSPTGLNLSLSLTKTAYPEVTLYWDQHLRNETHFYGYSFALRKDSAHIDEICLTTIYKNKKLADTSFRAIGRRNYLNLSHVLSKPLKFEGNYTLKLAAMPVSEYASFSFEIPSAKDMCQAYERQSNETLLHCYFVHNLTLNENCENNIINVTWTLPKDLPKKQFSNFSRLTVGSKIIEVSFDKNYYVINKSRNPQTVIVQLVDSDGNSAHSLSVTKHICLSPTTVVAPNKNTTSKPKLKTSQSLIMQVAIIGSIASLFVVTLFVFIWVYRHKKGKNQFIRLISADPSSPSEESVLLVYPGGCVELEKLVVAIAALLHSIDIEVIAECTHAQEAAPNIAGFYAHYSEYVNKVVLICTEPMTTENPYHCPFIYVYKNMVEEQCMRRSDRKRFLAMYLRSYEKENVPPLLQNHSYLIPNEFEEFILAVYGLKTWPGYKNDILTKLEGCARAKKELQAAINRLNLPEHPHCSGSACKNGELYGDEHSRVISMSELTEQYSVYTKGQDITSNNQYDHNDDHNGFTNYGRSSSVLDGFLSSAVSQATVYTRALSYKSQTSEVSDIDEETRNL